MYMTTQAIPLAVLLSKLAHGLPNSPAPSSTPVYSISQVAEFDNIAGTPAIGASPVGSNSIYENLKWNGFSLIETLAPTTETPLLIPQSAPNLIGFGTDDLETIDEGTPMITVNYEDSSIIYFTLGTFFYGCTAATEASVVGVPVSCNITVTGFGPPSTGSKQIATQTFEFVASGLSQDMNEAPVSNVFQGLYSAVFTLQSAENAITEGFLDNVATTIFAQSPVVVSK